MSRTSPQSPTGGAAPDAAREAATSRLWAHAVSHRREFLLGVLALLGTHVATQAIPWLLKLAIDQLQAAGQGKLAPGAVSLTRWILLMVLFAAAGAGLRVVSRLLIFNAGRSVEYELRRDLLGHLLALAPSFYRSHPTGDVMSRLTNDVGMVRTLVGFGVLTAVNVVLAYLGSVPLLLVLDWRLGLCSLVPYVLMALIMGRLSRRVFAISARVQERLGQLSSALQEDLSGALVVRSYGMGPGSSARFGDLGELYLRENLQLVTLRGLLLPMIGLCAGLATVVVLFLGGGAVQTGRMTQGDFVAFVAYLGQLAWPTVSLGWLMSMVERGRAAMVRLEGIFQAEVTIADPAATGTSTEPGPAPASVRGELEVRHLSLELGGRRLLDDVSLKVPAGARVALVGRTGSGKSLLVEALARLWEVPPGTVFLDGRDITSWPLIDLRRAFAYAPQEAFLFSASIGENICFGCESPPAAGDGPLYDAALARRAAADAGLERDLAEFPDGLETVVGERGITLSGGQRQRVALARALAISAPVLLLDDSLSSVDAHTERRILGQLQKAMANRTSILISHRVAAVRDADLIVVLDEGRVVEQGTHDELAALGGVYAQLYERQLLVDELGSAAQPGSAA